jgi:hypothetical protein
MGVVRDRERGDILPLYRIAHSVETLWPGVQNRRHVGKGINRGAFYDIKDSNTRYAVFCFYKVWYCVYDNSAAHAVSDKLISALLTRLTRAKIEGAHKKRRRGGRIGKYDLQKIIEILYEDFKR